MELFDTHFVYLVITAKAKGQCVHMYHKELQKYVWTRFFPEDWM